MGLPSNADLSRHQSEESSCAVPNEQSQRRTSVIGFVHAPQDAAVDGVMVTITYVPRRSRGGTPWGFVSEVHKSHNFATRDEAMRAAEDAFRSAATSVRSVGGQQ